MKYECKQADAEIGLKIKQRRKILRVTQKELADAIGVTFQQVQKYENGHSRISMSTFMNICDELRAEPSSFFCNVALCEDEESDFSKEISLIDIEKKALSILRSIKNTKIQSKVLKLLELLAANFEDE